MRQLVNAVRENPLKYFELSQIMINIPTILTGKVQKINSDGKQSYLSQNWRVRQSIMRITSRRNRSKVNLLKNSTNPPHSNFIEGLLQVIPALDTFLDTSSQDSESEDFLIRVYDTVHLQSGEILRTSGNFQGKE